MPYEQRSSKQIESFVVYAQHGFNLKDQLE